MKFKPTDQTTKSLIDFASKLPLTLRGFWRLPAAPPTVPLVVRIAAAGHLHIDFEASLQRVVLDLFSAIQEYVEAANPQYAKALLGLTRDLPQPKVRVLCQLASGMDQIAARAALSVNFDLHVVLPGSRRACERSIRQSQTDWAGNSNELGANVARLDAVNVVAGETGDRGRSPESTKRNPSSYSPIRATAADWPY